MAISRQTATGKQKTQITLYSAAMATCLFAAAPTSAQTVIIGGGNDRPVVVNYPPAYSPAYPQARQPVTQGVAIPSQNGVDYSKGARIEAGDEVIVLTPPSQQKKRPAKVVRPAKKKPYYTFSLFHMKRINKLHAADPAFIIIRERLI